MTTLTRAQVRELDRRAIREFGMPGVVLMENAGRSAAELLLRHDSRRDPVTIFCGKGNNGGDGFVIARHLDLADWPVQLVLVADTEEIAGDAAINLRVVQAAKLPMLVIDPSQPLDVDQLQAILAASTGWLVDALFGTGLSGPLAAPFDAIIAAMNASGRPILAIDIPSGLDCDTGAPLGPCVEATHTVTFVAPKAGFSSERARQYLGTLHVTGIGAPRSLLREYGL